MLGTTTTKQVAMLKSSAKHHEEQGNSLLASWMRASAEHFEEVERRTNQVLDNIALGNYGDARMSKRGQFAHEWYAYEDEYAYNYNGLN